jgi:hypothetical protein
LVTKVEARNRCEDDVTIVIKDDIPIVLKTSDQLETGTFPFRVFFFFILFDIALSFILFIM